ncbi:MAG: transporter, family, cyanate transporter, partial [Solirubrobacteraceae bacterium]|nr:transporter, family, cyanate transporter [Solirubrobacteraceae bacterium]
FLVLGVVLIAFNMRTAIAEIPPVLPDLGLAPGAQSVLATVPVICFGLAALASPALRGRLGEERGLLLVFIVLLAGVIMRAAWPGAPSALFGGTVLAGCAIAVTNVLVPSLVRRRFAGHVGLMMGVYTAALAGGGALAAGTTVPLRDATGSLPLALGIWAVPIALAIAVWLPQRRHRALPAVPGGAEAFRALGRSPLAWQVTLFMGLMSLLYYGPLSWLPAIERDRGIDPATAGLLLSVLNLVSLPSTLVAPMLAHRMRDQRTAVAIGTILTMLGVAGILLAPASAALASVVVLGIGQGMTLPLALLMIVMRAGDDETAAHLSTMAQGVGYLLAAAGPLVMGLLHVWTGGWTVPLILLLGLTFLQLWVGLLAGRARTIHARA